MGNAHGQGGERRKSRGTFESFSSAIDPLGPSIVSGRRPSGGSTRRGHHFSDAEPVQIGVEAQEYIKKIPAHRPRATTEVSRPTNFKIPKRSQDVSGPRSGPDHHQLGISPGYHHSDSKSSENSDGNSAIVPEGMPTIFKFNGNAKEVYVCGTFNDWQKLKMSKSTKDFVAIVDLKEGEHEYKFLVDGEWRNDPSTETVQTTGGFKNNVIKVQKADFNAYEALDMDSEAVAKLSTKKKYSDSYGQEVPVISAPEHRSGPPILPPHLLQVILNKDTPLSCEPTLLPEPNHVMLNHLYALSIKDGVMVLSSTQRYKKKYVTTLLYKPMGSRKSS